MRLSPIFPLHAGKLVVLMALTALSLPGSRASAGPALEWTRQFGTFGGDSDSVAGLSLDGQGNVYLSGETWGSLGGLNAGGGDGYVAKYHETGSQVWLRQFGTASRDRSLGISADGLGNVFQTGALGGFFISKSDATGNEIWRRPPAGISGSGISADGMGSAYVTGTLGRPLPDDQGVLEKLDAAGNQLWSRQFGTTDHEQSLRVSADMAGNVFAYGVKTPGDSNTFQPSATLTKFDANGNEYWTRTVESARYVNRGGVAADGLGNVYITGNSNAPILKPRVHLGYDAFVAKYNAAGNRVWLQEFGTAEFADDARSVAVDGLGNVFVVGNMGAPFLAKFDVGGNQLWLHQFGAADSDVASLVAADGAGKVYVAGQTRGDLGGPNAGGGGYDVFLAKFNVNVPEPSTGLLLVISAGMGLASRRLRRDVI